jgi:bifunctional DNA-binding transcriptional regulator/antitoxin component of YhaV-PrlF toxin-antitoxin module
MKVTTITLSTKGQFSLPKKIRESDHVEASDIFRLERLAPGKYMLEKLTPPTLPKAKLVRSKDGFLVFQTSRTSARITSELVKKLEAETV